MTPPNDLDRPHLDQDFPRPSTHPEDPRQQMRHLVLLIQEASRLLQVASGEGGGDLEWWSHVKDWQQAARLIRDDE